jgi:hypothetical protein
MRQALAWPVSFIFFVIFTLKKLTFFICVSNIFKIIFQLIFLLYGFYFLYFVFLISLFCMYLIFEKVILILFMLYIIELLKKIIFYTISNKCKIAMYIFLSTFIDTYLIIIDVIFIY